MTGPGGAPQLDERTIEYTEALLFAGTHDSPRELAERILGGLVEAELIGPPLAASPGAGELDLTDGEVQAILRNLPTEPGFHLGFGGNFNAAVAKLRARLDRKDDDG